MSQGQSSGSRERDELLKTLLSIFEGWEGENPNLGVVVGILKSFKKLPVCNVKQETVKVEPERDEAATTNSDNFDIIAIDNEEENEKEAVESNVGHDDEAISENESVEEPNQKKRKVSKKSKSKSKEMKPIPELLTDISEWMDSPTKKDDILLSSWFNVWTCTDGSDENCELFYSSGGIEMVKKCADLCLVKPELAEVMLGALGNVVEVDELRPKLMTLDVIKLLYKLLYPASQQKHLLQLKIRYGAASVLMEILRDEPEMWKIEKLDRNVVLNEIRHQIEKKWDVSTDEIVKTFSYKSLKHIWRLFRVTHTVECHLFASWTVANLCVNIPDKYGLLLKEEEKGVGWKLLNEIRSSSQDPKVVKYAKIAIAETSEFYNSLI